MPLVTARRLRCVAALAVDRDHFSFAVPGGAQLSALMLVDATVSGGVSFFAIQAGPQLTVQSNGVGADALLGYGHCDNAMIGSDLLAASAIKFPGPLPAGTVSVGVQETGGPATYDLDFQISAVPEPGAAALMLAGRLGLAAVSRAKCRPS